MFGHLTRERWRLTRDIRGSHPQRQPMWMLPQNHGHNETNLCRGSLEMKPQHDTESSARPGSARPGFIHSPEGRQNSSGVPLGVKDGRTDCRELGAKTTQEQRVLKSTNPPLPPASPARLCSALPQHSPDCSARCARFTHPAAPAATGQIH